MTLGGAATPAPREPAERLAAAVLAVPGVAALHPGMFGEVGTYLPGRRVAGIRVTDEAVDVHVVIVFGAAVRETAAAVRATVGRLHPGVTVNVTVEDVAPAVDTRSR
ncbi:Asp23/Gls24 family envelope stress response protein [Mycolicibacterium gilvum]|uniref:Asp23/Gls24 family envelope stress response protein n=1 Tax=Mycolicibacterium gilvum TaxID=1804 RepID=A0A378SF10_9MYCO|nr:Asp23/Gls24 family envelope stress response protein [Mycolicibacterium gilvum]MCV7058366.1 Asp23/Gls24 family envelope stress response protein [Mycolicibacterium gilvum]STZ41290.1 Uncharacterised protein [Mycolicibacterium gilvum]